MNTVAARLVRHTFDERRVEIIITAIVFGLMQNVFEHGTDTEAARLLFDFSFAAKVYSVQANAVFAASRIFATEMVERAMVQPPFRCAIYNDAKRRRQPCIVTHFMLFRLTPIRRQDMFRHWLHSGSIINYILIVRRAKEWRMDRILSPHGEVDCLKRPLPDLSAFAEIISDKFVTARKPGPCRGCNAVINKGDRARSVLAKLPGRVTVAARYCHACCYDITKQVPLRSQGEFVMPSGNTVDNDLILDGDGDREGWGGIILIISAVVVAAIIVALFRLFTK